MRRKIEWDCRTSDLTMPFNIPNRIKGRNEELQESKIYPSIDKVDPTQKYMGDAEKNREINDYTKGMTSH